MIDVYLLGITDSGELLISSNPKTGEPEFRLVLPPDIAGRITGTDPSSAADSPLAEFDDVDDQEDIEDPEPEITFPEGPIEVESPAAALEAARGLWLIRDEQEMADESLREAVHQNLCKWNVRIDGTVLDEGWWVTKLGDRAWQISFRFLSRGRIHEAEWVLDTERARLEPENDLAATLGWVKRPPDRVRTRRRRRSRGRTRTTAKKR